MRGAMTEVGGVMGVMAGDGPSDSRTSLSGLSNETSSVASMDQQQATFPPHSINYFCVLVIRAIASLPAEHTDSYLVQSEHESVLGSS